MSDNVVILNNNTRLDLPVERILNGALKEDLESVTLIGWDKEGKLYFATSYGKCADCAWHIDQAKNFLLNR